MSYTYGSMIYTAERDMKTAVILRLLGNGLLAFIIASSYSGYYHIIRHLYFNRKGLLLIVIAVLIVDSVLPLLWRKSDKLFLAHKTAAIFAGGFHYMALLTVCLDVRAALLALVFAPCLWLVGMLPFKMFNKADKQLKHALKEQTKQQEEQSNE